VKEHSYESPAAFKMAVESRLRTESARTGTDLQRLRQLLVFDRFLARLFLTFREAVVLKGGLVLELRLARARATKDIDLRMLGAPDDILPRLQEAGRRDLGDFLTFGVQPDPHHPELDGDGMQYTGRRYRAEPHLAGKVFGRPFGVDVAFAEPLPRPPEILRGSAFLAFAGIPAVDYRVYPLEAHIAEKLHAYTLPRPMPNSRVKDLPDLALLASVRALDAASLADAIQQTFAQRATHAAPQIVPDPPAGWTAVYARMAATDGLRWPTIDKLLDAVRTFLNPVLAGHRGRWDPQSWTWS
jgi:predicted nucleotidyltransferase component of viral defense system